MTSRNSVRVRGPMTIALMVPTLVPPWRTLSTRVAKSCIAPMNTTPTTIQSMEGSQPYTTATAGPMIGAAPAMEA